MAEDDVSPSERLAQILRSFAARAREQSARLEELRAELEAGAPSGAAIEEVERIAHRLHGTSGTLGYAELGAAAAELETLCAAAGDRAGGAGQEIFAAIDRLRAEIAGLPASP